MKKILLLVESPSKAKNIQKYLGNHYKVIATKGHIADLAKGGKHGIGIDINNNFKPHYVLMDDKYELLDEILKEVEDSDMILIGSDPDREGEGIAWHLMSRLAGCQKPIKRVEFKEITKNGIINGINNPRDINENLFHAQESRRILDRIVGFMASPFLMNIFGSTLSAGRVQSVVTKMIVDREYEIKNFIPEEYWVIKALFDHNNFSFSAKYEPKIINEKDALSVKDLLEKKDTKFVVTQVKQVSQSKKPPAPMITSQLQRIMAKSFNFSADRTMKAAQSLYEAGYVTYIRTDSVRTDPDALKNLRDWLKLNKFQIPKKPNVFETKKAAQDAHECIRPTDLNLKPGNNVEFSTDENKVYEIIWKYFIASQMNPAIYDTLTVNIQVKGKKEHFFKASGKALKDKGFFEILGISDDSSIDIPNLNKNDELLLFGENPISLEKKFTQPPPRYSNDSLIKIMEQKEIGRPSTYAEVLSKITSRNYVELDGKTYRPTDLGIKITDMLADFFSFMSYDYTASVEKKLDDIELGVENSLNMLKNFYSSFKEELNKAYIKNGKCLCDKCGCVLIERTSKTNEKFLGCSGYPKCRFTKQIIKAA